jgi:hypothetical protein
MLATVLGAVLPMVVTVLLGFVAAWHHDFGPKDAPILNRMVLVYAKGLSLYMLKAVLEGRAGDLVDLGRTNLLR